MALKNKVSTPYGVDVTYFKIVHTVIVWHTRTAKIRIAGFVSKDARDSGADKLVHHDFDISPENFPFDPERPVIKDAYDYVKKFPEFKNFEDV